MSSEAENPVSKVVEKGGGGIDLATEVERLKAEIATLKNVDNINRQIKEDAEQQMMNIRPLPNPAKEGMTLDEMAEQEYTRIVEEIEEMKYVNGVDKKFCVREHGVDRDITNLMELKVRVMQLMEEEDPSLCTKKDIIKMIKRTLIR